MTQSVELRRNIDQVSVDILTSVVTYNRSNLQFVGGPFYNQRQTHFQVSKDAIVIFIFIRCSFQNLNE